MIAGAVGVRIGRILDRRLSNGLGGIVPHEAITRTVEFRIKVSHLLPGFYRTVSQFRLENIDGSRSVRQRFYRRVAHKSLEISKVTLPPYLPIPPLPKRKAPRLPTRFLSN